MPERTDADSPPPPVDLEGGSGVPEGPGGSGPGSKKVHTLTRRAASTAGLLAILLAALLLGQEWIYAVLFWLLAMGALVEYFRLFPLRGFRRFQWQTYGVSAVYIVLLFAPLWGWEAAWLGALDGIAAALLVALVVLGRLRHPIEGFRTLDEIAASVFGFVYCVLLFGFVAKVLMLPLEDSAGGGAAIYYALYLVAVTKLTDIGAYLVGTLIGRDKMVPHVSPGKTWQGFGGAIFFAFAGSYLLCFAMGAKIPLITPLHAGVLALALSLVSVLGDLAESILKRSLEAKDSGRLMPGIGGFLDLIDSVIFTAPLFYLYLLVLLQQAA